MTEKVSICGVIADLTGRQFGRMTVLAFSHVEKGAARWHCRCECGTEKVASGSNLKGGSVQSCGCLNELDIARPTKHGMSYSSEYHTWQAMIARCYKPKTKCFSDYGGRGITVCDRWRCGEDGKNPFDCFLEDIGLRPEGRSLDRIDNETSSISRMAAMARTNCRWATWLEQENNRRPNFNAPAILARARKIQLQDPTYRSKHAARMREWHAAHPAHAKKCAERMRELRKKQNADPVFAEKQAARLRACSDKQRKDREERRRSHAEILVAE